MANTVLITGNVINVSAMDSDYDMGAVHPHLGNSHREFKVRKIMYFGNAADKLVVKNGADDAAVIAEIFLTAEQRFGEIDFGENGFLCKPYIDYSDCVVAGTERAIFILV